jgi:hypothetical protein
MVNSQAKGKKCERDIARYLTALGLPARREVRTGTADVHDEGDLVLKTVPVTIEAKDHQKSFSPAQLAALMAKLERQKRPGDLGLLVIKKAGRADPAHWHCWVSGWDAARLIGNDPSGTVSGVYTVHPVCFTFSDVARLIILGDWAEKLVNPFR